MDILAGSRDQTFSSQLLGRVYFNCKCSDVYAGSCNNALVKILIQEVPYEENFSIYLIFLAVADMAIYV